MTYNTKQRALLRQFLTENAHAHVTTKEILDYARSEGIGAATVYRYLDKLTREGLLFKFSGDSDGGACYQWHDSTCRQYHFVCSDCGKCFHVSCTHLSSMHDHFSADHDFEVDLSKTVFCGRCGTCKKKETV